MAAVRRLLPAPTGRLRFREMSVDDLDHMAALLGDPQVMAYYPAPKTRQESLDWITRMQSSYAEHGHGLWVIETHEGEFLGMTYIDDDRAHPWIVRTVMGMRLDAAPPR